MLERVHYPSRISHEKYERVLNGNVSVPLVRTTELYTSVIRHWMMHPHEINLFCPGLTWPKYTIAGIPSVLISRTLMLAPGSGDLVYKACQHSITLTLHLARHGRADNTSPW